VGANYHLDTWGNFRFPEELNSSKNRFSFTGYIWDKETSLFFAKARFYDPQIGRFISQDSFLGNIDEPPSLQRYFYAYANPTRYFDPTGHQTEEADSSEFEKIDEFLEWYHSETDPKGEQVQEEAPGFFERAWEKAKEGYRAVKSYIGITEDGPVAGGDPAEDPEEQAAL